ncbi:notch ligand family member [Anaeramoeba flamelloides]|uniref:Notch ligand family member n=1 Tax=Anaeramoeba flamelloides TaxID=1746091 RepID=A0ABQ8X5X0_9EUKA|nr:notch ligand family member [Anaeramoeba flamelloides]
MTIKFLAIALLIFFFPFCSTTGTALTETVTTNTKFFASYSPTDVAWNEGWIDLPNAQSVYPTLKDSPPTNDDDYLHNSAQTRIKANNPVRSFELSDFGYNLPPASQASLTIDEINFSSIRDAAPIKWSKDENLNLEWIWDSNLYFYMPNVAGSDTLSMAIIESDDRETDSNTQMLNWGSESDLWDCQTLRTFGGSRSVITSNAHAIGVCFTIDGDVKIDYPTDPPSDDVPDNYPDGKYRWNLVIGTMNTSVKYSYKLEVDRIFPKNGKIGDLIKVYLISGSIVDEDEYNGMTVKYSCKFGDTKYAADQYDKENSWIGCIAPDLDKGINYTIDVSFYDGDIDSIPFTESGIEFMLYNDCVDDNACENNGTCLADGCDCEEGFFGETCEQETCPDGKCNSGTCIETTGECQCDDGWGGEYCDIDLCMEEYNNCTYPQGRCIYSGQSGYCYCDPDEGYTGTDCNTHKCTTKDCGQYATPERGRCLKDGTCRCETNYAGSNCQIMNCLEDDTKCENGECQEEDGSCECETGYTGTFCDYYLCDAIECKNGGECIVETGQCKCKSGYTGANCETETEPDNWADKAADAMGISSSGFLAFFICVICVGGIAVGLVIFFLWRRHSERDRFYDILSLPIYDLQTLFGENYYISDEEISNITKPSMKKMLFDLQELLLEHLDFVNCLCLAAETKVADYLSKSLLYIFEVNGESPLILKYFLEKEVNGCEDSDLLFRGYSMASKLWSSFCHLAYGIEYLHLCLSQPMYDLLKDQDKMEVELDPDLVKEMGAQVTNKYNLMAATESFISSIINNGKTLPPQFRFVLSYTRELLEEKFPDRICQAIGGMMILRYFVPAITACDDYGIISEDPDDELLRTLILVAKVLINLANGTLFGVKEEYMSTLNDFINDNQDRVNQYLLEISTPTEESMDELSFENSPLPPDVLEISCANVHRYMTLNSEEINETMEMEIEDEERRRFLFKEMQSLIFKIGEPINIQADEDV